MVLINSVYYLLVTLFATTPFVQMLPREIQITPFTCKYILLWI